MTGVQPQQGGSFPGSIHLGQSPSMPFHPSQLRDSLIAYSDADWAGCPTTRRSTLGYCVFLGNNLLSWSSKRQPTLSRSSAEAEYRGVANAVAETCWIRNLLRELHTPLSSATIVYCDNVSAVYLSSNPVQHQRTKHIEIDIHFVRDLVATGQVRVLHVPSRFQYADIFTKGLPSALFEEFRTSLSVRCPPAPTAGEDHEVTGTVRFSSAAPVSTLAMPAEPPQKKPSFQMSAPDDFEVLRDDNHSTAPVQGNAPTINAASTLAMPAEPPQKKPAFQMSAPDVHVLDDDNHSTERVKGNAPTTNAASTLALPAETPQKKPSKVR
ncbi:ribonuclease H-like domain-containing protein, partial [Tanacetum coccineum]